MNKIEKEKLICKFMNWESFHMKNSLDELLPIINKIENLYFSPNGRYSSSLEVNIYRDKCEISYNGYYSGTIKIVKDKNRIKSVYNAIIAFIKWYYEDNRYMNLFN